MRLFIITSLAVEDTHKKRVLFSIKLAVKQQRDWRLEKLGAFAFVFLNISFRKSIFNLTEIMRNETKIYLLYILQRLQSCIYYVFYHVQKKVNRMEFIEIFTYCSVLLVARYVFSLLKENKLLTQLLVDMINSCFFNLHMG